MRYKHLDEPRNKNKVPKMKRIDVKTRGRKVNKRRKK